MNHQLAALVCCATLLLAAGDDRATVHADEEAGGSVDVVQPTPAPETPDDVGEPEADDDGDSAPFTLVVEHADGWRCSASLVSLRTAVTSARCARGPAPPAPPAPPARDLWVHAPPAPAAAPHASRRVARVVLADADEDDEGADVAVLELEAPLGGGARAILMATSAADCAVGAASGCHVVRARRRGARSWLRIVDEALVEGHACAALAPQWPPARHAPLCLRGDRLCQSEWGAGVVCEGKLCGVLSGSACEPPEPCARAHCGALHAAQPVARYRRFLHCAHTPRACRRGGECAHLCSETNLLEDDARTDEPLAEPPDSSAATAAREFGDAPGDGGPTPPHRTSSIPDVLEQISSSTRRDATTTLWPSTRPQVTGPTRTAAPGVPPAPPASPPSPPPSPHPARAAAEFEPNRPDFKAGEYGDNAAEYGGDEAPPPTRTPPPAPAAPAASASAARPVPTAGPAGPDGDVSRVHEVAARVSPATQHGAYSSASPALGASVGTTLVLCLYIAI